MAHMSERDRGEIRGGYELDVLLGDAGVGLHQGAPADDQGRRRVGRRRRRDRDRDLDRYRGLWVWVRQGLEVQRRLWSLEHGRDWARVRWERLLLLRLRLRLRLLAA